MRLECSTSRHRLKYQSRPRTVVIHYSSKHLLYRAVSLAFPGDKLKLGRRAGNCRCPSSVCLPFKYRRHLDVFILWVVSFFVCFRPLKEANCHTIYLQRQNAHIQTAEGYTGGYQTISAAKVCRSHACKFLLSNRGPKSMG
jgi:hypothetical protein